jgi:hypothetical protein
MVAGDRVQGGRKAGCRVAGSREKGLEVSEGTHVNMHAHGKCCCTVAAHHVRTVRRDKFVGGFGSCPGIGFFHHIEKVRREDGGGGEGGRGGGEEILWGAKQKNPLLFYP